MCDVHAGPANGMLEVHLDLFTAPQDERFACNVGPPLLGIVNMQAKDGCG
jgi:hypothetical protein